MDCRQRQTSILRVLKSARRAPCAGPEGDHGLGRHSVDPNISKYMLADYYWPAFKASIRSADAKGVMCSYNSGGLA